MKKNSLKLQIKMNGENNKNLYDLGFISNFILDLFNEPVLLFRVRYLRITFN